MGIPLLSDLFDDQFICRSNFGQRLLLGSVVRHSQANKGACCMQTTSYIHWISTFHRKCPLEVNLHTIYFCNENLIDSEETQESPYRQNESLFVWCVGVGPSTWTQNIVMCTPLWVTQVTNRTLADSQPLIGNAIHAGQTQSISDHSFSMQSAHLSVWKKSPPKANFCDKFPMDFCYLKANWVEWPFFGTIVKNPRKSLQRFGCLRKCASLFSSPNAAVFFAAFEKGAKWYWSSNGTSNRTFGLAIPP